MNVWVMKAASSEWRAAMHIFTYLKFACSSNKQWRRVVIIGGGMPIIQHVVWPRDIYSQPLVAGLSDGIEETPAELSRAEPASTQRFTQR